jgi:hypothetical protein
MHGVDTGQKSSIPYPCRLLNTDFLFLSLWIIVILYTGTRSALILLASMSNRNAELATIGQLSFIIIQSAIFDPPC